MPLGVECLRSSYDDMRLVGVKDNISWESRCQLLVVKTASTRWTNLLMCHDPVLSKVKDNISFESYMSLRNSPLLSLEV